MLDHDTRTAILRLRAEQRGLGTIAHLLGVSKNAVRRVVRSGRAHVPRIERAEKLDEHLDTVRELHARCKGNLVRVQEELETAGIAAAYSTLTGFCRRHGIGVEPKERAGRYPHEPGQEMQHDTSPHDVEIGNRRIRLQCASLVLCFSRMIFAQLYPRFDRFWCKAFLTEAFLYFSALADRCVIDNTHVILAGGSGKNAIVAPEMVGFAERFGFHFRAHEIGDANRSALVERPFDYIERNFYPGRSFVDRRDANRQMRAWCDKANGRFKRSVRARPVELFAAERSLLHPLPPYVPEVYRLHHRRVDVEGYVTVHTNRYSVDAELIDRHLECRETKDQVRLFDGHRLIAEHPRLEDGEHDRSTLPEHRRQPRWRDAAGKLPPTPQESALRAAGEPFVTLIDALQKKHGGRAARHVGRLHRLWLDYPVEPLRAALARSLEHGLLDLERIERVVLQQLAGNFFRLDDGPFALAPTPDHEDDNE